MFAFQIRAFLINDIKQAEFIVGSPLLNNKSTSVVIISSKSEDIIEKLSSFKGKVMIEFINTLHIINNSTQPPDEIKHFIDVPLQLNKFKFFYQDSGNSSKITIESIFNYVSGLEKGNRILCIKKESKKEVAKLYEKYKNDKEEKEFSLNDLSICFFV